MGGAASVETPGDQQKPAPSRRQVIFEAGDESNQTFRNVNDLFEKGEKDPAVYSMLYNGLSGFFILDDDSKKSSKVDLLIRAMKKETLDADFLLINEGEPGKKLYVVESGELEVTINGQYIRTMVPGSLLGELALLYDAPRSATVKTKTPCVMWTLRREVFKTIQAVASSALQIQRARWLVHSKELAILSATNLSRLIATLRPQTYLENQYLYTETVATNQCVLIESGYASVYSTVDLSGKTAAQIDLILGIVRPKAKRKSVANMNSTQLKNFVNEGGNDAAAEAAGDATKEGEEKEPEAAAPKVVASGFLACEVYEGCLLGIGALRSKANLPESWEWKNFASGETGLIPAPSDLLAATLMQAEGNEITTTAAATGGAVAGYSVVAGTKMQCIDFTVDAFENLFGPASVVLSSTGKGNFKDGGAQSSTARTQRKFDFAKFEMKHVLGSGSFGTVALAEYRDVPKGPCEVLALKLLSKSDVIETGQLRHVLDERKLLGQMDSIFVLKLLGTYQTPHRIVMVTEVLECGDLWSVIYEVPAHYDKRGLPKELSQFYSASLVLALHHIHGKGIVFRDLKPENVMLDAKGYLRIIDFGFAKVVPYTAEVKGEMVMNAKTYTLCGTPEYLAPEFIFNLGHDASSDLWALGVVIHEMTMACTPFSPSRQGDMTELFTNIATVKRNGLKLSPKITQRPGGLVSAGLISALLKPEPSERISVQTGSTKAILEHPYFTGLDIGQLEAGRVTPPYLPQKAKMSADIKTLPVAKPFKGQQSQFADF